MRGGRGRVETKGEKDKGEAGDRGGGGDIEWRKDVFEMGKGIGVSANS